MSAKTAARGPLTFPLALKPAPSTVHRPAAWFIPGDDPAAWLDELSGWGVPLSGLRLHVVPRSLRDRRPAGVLVTTPAGSTPKPSPRVQPYGLIAGRLYLPADAALDPPLSDAELREKLLWPVQVLHPSAGVAGFGEEDVLRVSDLLAAPPPREADWGHAQPGIAPPPRLLSVEPEQVPTAGAIFDEGRGDIGSGRPSELPPGPGESAVRDTLSKASQPGLKFVKWLSSKGGAARGASESSGASWMGRVGDWATRKLTAITQELEEARHRELNRLQKLLESDPDEGLKYAIPIRDTGTRGLAPPGASLPPRDTHFSLSHLGGGKAGDAWSVPWEIQQQLVVRYRAAANREMNLGRYRRAAYIFAELLGDLLAAASALEQGRHYREAAALYREYLKNPAKAAECLERGGLLLEAIAVYEETGAYEKAGDLYATIDRPEDATRCYRAAVERLVASQNIPAAARLLETKLNTPDEALDLLTAAWPAGAHPDTCLRQSFDLLGRLGRHEETTRRVKRLRDEPVPVPRVGTLAGVLSAVARSYPNPGVRAAAADVTRVVAGRRLGGAEGAERTLLIAAVTELAPEDRLLVRDGNRYLARKSRPAVPPRTSAATKGRTIELKGPVVVHQFRLPDDVTWHAVASRGSEFVCVGALDSDTIVLRGRWDGQTHTIVRREKVSPSATVSHLEPVPNAPGIVIVPRLGQLVEVIARWSLPATDAFPNSLELSCPAYLAAEGPVAMAFADSGLAWVLRSAGAGRASVSVCRAETGEIRFTHHVAAPADSTGTFLPKLVVRKGQAFIAWGSAVLSVNAAGNTTTVPLPRPIRALAASAPFTRVRVAAAMTEGGAVLWEDGSDQPFGEGLFDPHVAFTRGGMLVAVTRDEGRVYRTDDGQVRHHATFKGPAGAPLAVVPTNKINEFAVFTVDGLVRVYQIPG